MVSKYNGEEIVLALGFFDGVHKGHQQIIQHTVARAREKGLKSAIMTFTEHPLNAIFPTYAPFLLTGNIQKIRLMKELGIDYVFLNDFDETLMRLSPQAFIGDYLLGKYNVAEIVVGFNYTFGYKGKGTTDTLKEYGEIFDYEVQVVEPFVIGKQAVSSTFIRQLISSGAVDKVETYLGRKYRVEGPVVIGKGLGHRYDMPTANLRLNEPLILPGSGVYYTTVDFQGQILDGLTNLGFNPTFEKHPYSIETYIYDFEQSIYGDMLGITFENKIRGEIKFSSVDELVTRVKSDIALIDRDYRRHK